MTGVLIAALLSVSGFAQSCAYLRLSDHPEARQRIEAGIRANRMGGTLEFRDAAGRVAQAELVAELFSIRIEKWCSSQGACTDRSIV